METLGSPPFQMQPDGRYLSTIATFFPRHDLLVTWPPLHALQRARFMDWLAERRRAQGATEPGEQQLSWEAGESVDLIVAPGDVLQIRPVLDRLDLARLADRALAAGLKIPQHRIRYLSVSDFRVRQSLRERGELWRMTAAPADPESVAATIRDGRIGILGRPIYYYNPHTGTRFLTFQEFQGLGDLNDADLAAHLDEIAGHCVCRNRHGNPEIAFFAADPLRFGAPNFVGIQFRDLAPADRRARWSELVDRFRDATDPDFRRDDPQAIRWRLEMAAAITVERTDAKAGSDALPGLALEFHLRVRWLPGGSIEHGGFVFAQVFADPNQTPADPDLKKLWDPLARGFIANFIREYGNIEYLNLGRIEPAPNASPVRDGRRGVYLAELKVREETQPRLVFLRVLRWGIRERLEQRDENGQPKDLIRAMFETEEYVDYTLDRRLGCLEFGMHLPSRVNLRRVSELYLGRRPEFRGRCFPVLYFERDYVPGIATNQLPERRLLDQPYALALARLLGKAAAPNLVVGRTRMPPGTGQPGRPLFDDGDEIVIEGSDGLPRDIVLVNQAGAFNDWCTPTLLPFARSYAEPVNTRSALLPDPRAFAEAYLRGLGDELNRIRSDDDRRRQDLDGLFRHLPDDPKGSFARRWTNILERLRRTDPDDFIAEVRRHITVLTTPLPAPESADPLPDCRRTGADERSAP